MFTFIVIFIATSVAMQHCDEVDGISQLGANLYAKEFQPLTLIDHFRVDAVLQIIINFLFYLTMRYRC